jgi:transposase
MINARAETVHEKPAYRDAFRQRRCLIPADGFYEWKPGNGKQSYFIHRQDAEPMAFAGLWEHWKGRQSGEALNSCASIVTDANAGLKFSNDQSDARHLAHLLRLGILPTGHIMPRQQREIRDLLRRRLLLVRQKTLHHLSLQSLIARYTGERMSGNEIKQLDGAAVLARLGDPVGVGGQVSLLAMQWLEEAIGLIERQVHKRLKPTEEYRIVTTMPGVGEALGSAIVLETGRVERFPDAGHYASYARCVKSERLSNGKLKGRGNAKSGNKYLSWAFMEAAHYAPIWSAPIKQYYQRHQANKHILVAKKAVANKLARACYHMLSKREPFDVKRAFG